MAAQHQFFHNFGYSESPHAQSESPQTNSNLFIMEIYNNWNEVKQLMSKYKNGELVNKQISQLDQFWIGSLLQNNIDVEAFDNEDLFYEMYIKDENGSK